MSQNFIEEAIPLVQIDENDGLQVNEKALEIISNIDGPIMIVGVVGLYRTGKSYFLNRVLLNRENGFGVDPSINACTKGIWIWGKPLKIQTDDNKILNILVIDSEGLGALDQDSSHDCRIFALVLLLSSLFIYNSVGTIDENQINNLSLVVNLTKHIHVKSRQQNNDQEDEVDDSDEFKKYFPSFLWLLRDFTLQLQDEFGNKISSKQYLESALQQFQGISDDIVAKNRIRRLISEFFVERDCFTLVRPTTEEKQLQNLNKLKMEDLRPEFTDQVYELRNRIFKSNKIKKLNNQNVNGDMFKNLLISYVSAINQGAVPNIENAWNYICQNQSQKIFNECILQTKQRVQNNLEEFLPMSEFDIKKEFKEIWNEQRQKYMTETFDKNKDEKLNELKNQIKTIKIELLQKNKKEFEETLQNVMEEYYSNEIFNQLLNNEIDDDNYLEKLEEFKNKFFKIEPNGPNKNEMILQFIYNKISQGIESLVNNQQEKNKNKIHQLEKKLIEIETENEEYQMNYEKLQRSQKNSVKNKENKIQSLEQELEYLKMQQKQFQDQKLKTETTLQVKLDDLNQQLKSQEKKFDCQIKKIKEEKSLNEQNFLEKRASYETEIALLKQKLEFYNNLEMDQSQMMQKMIQRQNDIELQYMKKEDNIKGNYEDQISDLNQTIQDLKLKQLNYEEELNDKKYNEQNNNKEFEQKQDQLQSFITQHENTILDLQNTIKEKSSNKKIDNDENKIENIIQEYKDKEKKLNQQIKQLTDENQILNIKIEKVNCLKTQKEEFDNIKILEMEKEIIELKKIKENTLNVMQEKQVGKDDFNKQLQEIKKQYQLRIENIQLENDKKKDEIQESYDNNIKDLQNELFSLKNEKENLFKEIQKLDEENEINKKEKENLKIQNDQIEQSKERIQKEMNELFQEKLKKKDEIIQNLEIQKEKEILNQKMSLENNFKNYEQIFEEEKQRIIQKMQNEKQRLKEEHENLLKRLELNQQEEIETFKENMEYLQQEQLELKKQIQNLQQKHENELKKLQLKNFDQNQMLEQDKELLKIKLDQEKKKNKNQFNSHLEELKRYEEDNEQLKQNLASKQSEYFLLEQKCLNFTEKANRFEENYNSLQNEMKENSENYRNQIKELELKKNEYQNELNEVKLQLTKNNALHSQQQQFIKQKNEELKRALDEIQISNDKKFQTIKNDYEKEIQDLKKRYKENQNNLEEEILEKKRQYKEQESKLNSKILELKKENYSQNEKLNYYQKRSEELEKQKILENGKQRQELRELKENYDYDKKNLVNEVDGLRSEKYELEIQLAETQAKYDKDKAVAEGKIQFLDSQNKKLKNDLMEHQSNFDVMFQKFHQFRVADKEEVESTHNAYVQSLEERFNQQIQEQKEQSENQIQIYKEKIKQQDIEIKNLQSKNQNMIERKYGSGIIQEKKISDLLESEKKLQQNLMNIKDEKDQLALQYHRELEKQKELMRKKHQQIENKLVKLEAEKNHQSFLIEKIKTQQNIEKDKFQQELTEKIENIEKMKKQQSKIMQENEKLRNSVKNLRKMNFGQSLFGMSKNNSEIYNKSILSSKEYFQEQQQIYFNLQINDKKIHRFL